MAKLGSYYGLCPLIDQNNLLGISEDYDPGHVIVTLGKNIAIKYKLSDQKQVHSWRTRDKFSSPVIYDKEYKYCAVFSQSYLKIWEGSEENLDKLKKYKFNKPIYTIIKCGGETFVIFTNGGIVPLKTALENRKNLKVDDVITIQTEKIKDVIFIDIKKAIYIGLVTESDTNTSLVCAAFVDGVSYNQYERVTLNRNNIKLTGYTFYETNDKFINLFTLWADGKLFSYQLTAKNISTDTVSCGEIYANIESVSCKQFVTMCALGNGYIAIYGAECNQEGAALILYNIQFKISQSKQSFKMFSNTTKMWCFDNNLLLCVGQSLAVVPFYLNTEQLAGLIGSHKILAGEQDLLQYLKIAEWDMETKCAYKSIPNKISINVLELFEQGLSELVICEYLIPIYIEKGDVECIISCLDYFKDIPEEIIIKLIKFCLSAGSVEDVALFECTLIDEVLKLPFSCTLLLPHARRELDINNTLLLLQYICHLLSSNPHCLPTLDALQTENKLIDWGCVLLDANYQKFLLLREEKAIQVLNDFRNIIQEHSNYLENLKGFATILVELNKGKSLKKVQHSSRLKYSIQEINLC